MADRHVSAWPARLVVAALVPLLVLAGCTEPVPDLDIGDRAPGQRVIDEVGVLEASVADHLEQLSAQHGVDVVALVFEDQDASLGQADRGGRAMLEAWGTDIVLVAVARPGDFTAARDAPRRRFFGVSSTDRFAVRRATRERIVEQVVPPLAAENHWSAAFRAAADVLAEDLAEG